MNAQDGSAENWLATFTQALRAQLPRGQYIITHARKSEHRRHNLLPSRLLQHTDENNSCRSLVLLN